MLSRTIGSLCRNTTMSLNEGRLNCSENTNCSMMRDKENATRKNSDSEADQSDEGGDQYENGSPNSNMTVFKKIFKKYKKKRPLPDLSEVIDPHKLGSYAEMSVNSLSDIPSLEALRDKASALGLKPFEEWKIATFQGRNGLFILPGVLTEEAQVEWTKKVFKYAEPPHTTNMTIHGTSPTSDVLKNAGTKLRWTILGIEYDWNTKEYPADGRALPEELINMGEVVSVAMGMKKMVPDATIINYYPPKTALSPHVDKSERSNAPLISLSFGQSAVYLSGGLSLDDPVIPIWLRSGDVLIMYGEQRLVYHAIPCIVPQKKYAVGDDKLFEDYINCSRINMTIRQVNP